MIANIAFHLDFHLHLHLDLDFNFDFFPPSSDGDLSPLPSPPLLSNTSIEHPYRIVYAILSRREESDIRHPRETVTVAVTVIRGLVYIQQDAQGIRVCSPFLSNIPDTLFIYSFVANTDSVSTSYGFLVPLFSSFSFQKDKISPNSTTRTQGKSLESVECIYVPQGASSYEIMRCAEQSCMASRVFNRPCNACYLILSTRTTRESPRRGTCMLGFRRAKLYYSFPAIRQRPSLSAALMPCHVTRLGCTAEPSCCDTYQAFGWTQLS